MSLVVHRGPDQTEASCLQCDVWLVFPDLYSVFYLSVVYSLRLLVNYVDALKDYRYDLPSFKTNKTKIKHSLVFNYYFRTSL